MKFLKFSVKALETKQFPQRHSRVKKNLFSLNPIQENGQN